MAIIVKDIEYTDDLVIFNGDFRLINSNEQHIEHIIYSYIGHYKEFPNLGVGIDLYRASSGQVGRLKSEIVNQLTNDGYIINKVVVDNSNIDEPKYYIDFDRVTNGNL